MSKVAVTKHGEKRIKERIGLRKNCVTKNAERALSKGVTHAETKGSLSRYLDGIYLNNEKPNNMRVYNRMIYLFRNNVLITVLPLPQKYHACADKLQKQKNDSNEEMCYEC